MNILFITIGQLTDINAPGIYTDLLREFKRNHHEVYVMTSREKRRQLPTEYLTESGFHFLRVKIGNITKCGVIEKGISTVMVERQYISALRKYLKDVRFDLVLYTTPPITFVKTVEYIRKRDQAGTYLILKDIFPQNAVDIGMMDLSGIKGILYKHFRKQEKRLYSISDHIGCMSQANVDYVIRNNPEVDPEKVEICPNTMDPADMSCPEEKRKQLREKYGIPQDKKVFIYGGNLGKPQDIPFIIQCMKACQDLDQAYFLIAGNGTEYHKLTKFMEEEKPENVRLIKQLPKDEYDQMVGSCDIGLIFLDHRFTIPNFPSRLLNYMAAKLPVLACTDPNTDIGSVVTEGGFGWWCVSSDPALFREQIQNILNQSGEKYARMQEKAYAYLMDHYSTATAYQAIIRHCSGQ